MLAILAAVTEIIKEKGGSETSTEYYAALVLKLFILIYVFHQIVK